MQDVADAATLSVKTALQFLPNFPQPLRRERDGTFVYEKNAWFEAVERSGTRHVGGVKRKWPGKPEAERVKFCKAEGMYLRAIIPGG